MEIKKIIKYSFLYISALLGAGFATGRELYAYFFSYGFTSGFIGTFAAALLFGLTAYKTLTLTDKAHLRTYDEFLGHIFGDNAGKAFYAMGILFFSVLFASMTAAFGEICRSHGIQPILARVIFCAICFVSLGFDIKGIAFISGILCPIMTVGCCIIGIYSIFCRPPCFDMPDILVLPSAFIYVSYNILTASAILTGTRFSQREARAAGIIIFFIVLTTAALTGAAAAGGGILPLYSAVKKCGVLFVLYTAVLICAIFTTALGNALCLMPQISRGKICTLGFLLSLVGFADIVDKFYFLFGIAGSGILCAILLCPPASDKSR